MLLGEAVLDKEYYSELLDDCYKHILDLVVTYDTADVKSNRSLLLSRLEELEDAYNDYQRFSILVGRAESSAPIQINNKVVTVRDARILKTTMEKRLGIYTGILEYVRSHSDQFFECMDIEELVAKIQAIKSDIKTMDSKIQEGLWRSELTSEPPVEEGE